jgi:hypothetical protein
MGRRTITAAETASFWGRWIRQIFFQGLKVNSSQFWGHREVWVKGEGRGKLLAISRRTATRLVPTKAVTGVLPLRPGSLSG